MHGRRSNVRVEMKPLLVQTILCQRALEALDDIGGAAPPQMGEGTAFAT